MRVALAIVQAIVRHVAQQNPANATFRRSVGEHILSNQQHCQIMSDTVPSRTPMRCNFYWNPLGRKHQTRKCHQIRSLHQRPNPRTCKYANVQQIMNSVGRTVASKMRVMLNCFQQWHCLDAVHRSVELDRERAGHNTTLPWPGETYTICKHVLRNILFAAAAFGPR